MFLIALVIGEIIGAFSEVFGAFVLIIVGAVVLLNR